ncbi:hypothetical protein ACOACO_17460 [Nocardioides sp. CPCC 205120]|uniref:hypothetical protein n=1 Tax=Nocardioides sp. CPCC 205120 TaxID=3406462 RepID=UPI003B50C7B6
MPDEAVTGLASEVKRERIHSLLLARVPSILQEGHEHAALLQEHLRSVTSEVVAVVGRNPAEGLLRDLAITAIAYGVAAEIEFALFPEQQLGEDARGRELRRRYDTFLTRLAAAAAAAAPADPDAPLTSPLSPTGSFPAPSPYPDPAEPARRWWSW